MTEKHDQLAGAWRPLTERPNRKRSEQNALANLLERDEYYQRGGERNQRNEVSNYVKIENFGTKLLWRAHDELRDTFGWR